MKKYLKLFERLRAAIISGGYAFGSRLPSKRAMANETGNSIVTVEHAYGLLCDEGYACARERSGFFGLFVPKVSPSLRAWPSRQLCK